MYVSKDQRYVSNSGPQDQIAGHEDKQPTVQVLHLSSLKTKENLYPSSLRTQREVASFPNINT